MFVNKNVLLFLLLIGLYLIASQSTSFGQAICHVDTYSLSFIKGVVVSDRLTGYEPIPEAKVELWKVRRKKDMKLIFSGKTDKNGLFAIENIKKGDYALTVSKLEWRYQLFTAAIKKVKRPNIEKRLWIRLGVTLDMEGCGESKLIDN